MRKLKCWLVFIWMFAGSNTFGQQLPARRVNIRGLDSIARFNPQLSRSRQNRGPFVSRKVMNNNIPVRVQQQLPQSLQAAVCHDTSGKFFLEKDSFNIVPDNYCRTKDGNLLLCGEYYNNYDIAHFDYGLLIKCDEDGNIKWTKLYDSANRVNFNYVFYYRVIELMDGSILMAGGTINNVTGNMDLLITKTDDNGNIIWSKTYKSRLWQGGHGSADYFYAEQIKQDPYSGDIYMTGPHWSDGRNVTRFSIANGNIVWSKYYEQPFGGSFDRPFGIAILPDKIVAVGTFSNYDNYTSFYVLDKNNGDTIKTKFFHFGDTTYYLKGFLTANSLRVLNNGDYALSGELFGYFQYPPTPAPRYQAGVAIFDSNFNFKKAYCFRNGIEGNSYNTAITMYPDGSGLFTMLSVYSGYTADAYYIQFKDGVIYKQRKKSYLGEGVPYEPEAIRSLDGGDMIMKLIGDSATNQAKTEFLKLHISDSASMCVGMEDHSTFIEPYTLRPLSGWLDSIGKNDFSESINTTLSAYTTSFNYLQGCQQVSFCDSLQLKSSVDTLCPFAPLYISIKKNKQCFSPVAWNYDSTAIQSFIQKNDTTVEVIFKDKWQGKFLGSLAGCTLLTDSVNVTVLKAPPMLNLGNDTVLCPGNTLNLNAGSGYKKYTWQDGSADSTFTVNAPGKYFVTVIDACDVTFIDSVTVAPHPPIPFAIGGDTSICKNDSIEIVAPAGFINYRWTNYNISSDTSQSVYVHPAKGTLYKVTAEQTSGCFVSDSLYISVKETPAIHLGNDTSLCKNNFLDLDAGPGFDSYSWNTGASVEKINVNTAGSFWVKGILNGCAASDTLQVLQVTPLPSFSLGIDTTLCEGTQLPFNFNLPNAFYQWNTGSVSNSLTIQQPGSYWLKVTQQGCTATDSVTVLFKASPRVYLGNDTLLCENQTVTLHAYNNNATYYWQDGNVLPEYVVKNAGTYIVTVDIDHCFASDTIAVIYRKIPHFTLGKDTLICIGETLLLQPTLQTTWNYLWQDGSISPSYSVNKEGLYSLTASNTCGRYTDSIFVKAYYCDILMPNAFTPNNDGVNDVFKVKYPFPVKRFQLTLYNRFGQKVYETVNINRGWDGRYLGLDAVSGSYIWIIDFTDLNNHEQQIKGVVTLLR